MADDINNAAKADTLRRLNLQLEAAPSPDQVRSGAASDTVRRAQEQMTHKETPTEGESIWGTMKQAASDFGYSMIGEPKEGAAAQQAEEEPLSFMQYLAGPPPAVGAMKSVSDALNARTADGKQPLLTSAYNSIVDAFSLGTSNIAFAAADAAKDADLLGAKDENSVPFDEALDSRILERELLLREGQEDNPMTSLVGSFIGGAAIGSTLASGAIGAMKTGAPRLLEALSSTAMRRVATAGGGSALLTGAYDAVKGDSPKKIAVDSGLAFIGGAALGAVFGEAVPALWGRWKMRKPDDVIYEGIGNQLMTLLHVDRLKKYGKNEPLPTPAQVEVEVSKYGPGATILDAFPGLQNLAKSVIQSAGDNATQAKNLFHLIATRNRISEELLSDTGVLRNMGGRSVVRTPTGFDKSLSRVFAYLRPRYKQALDDASGAPLTPRKQIDGAIDESLYSNSKATATINERHVAKALKKTLSVMSPPRGVSMVPGVKSSGDLTVAQLVSARKQIDQWLGNRSVQLPSKQPVGLKNDLYGKLLSVRSAISERIKEVAPNIAKLDAVYGNNAGALSAYRAGRAMVKNKALDSDDFFDFVNNPDKSALAVRSFVEGVKSQLFESLKNSANAADFERYITQNADMLDKLRGMLGEDELQAILNVVAPQVRKMRVAEELNAVNPALQKVQKPGEELSRAIDTGMIPLGIAGKISKVGGVLGPIERLFKSAVDPREAGMRANAFDEILGSMYGAGTLPARSALESLQRLMAAPIKPSQENALLRSMQIGTGSGAAISDYTGSE